jgi:hypothetical protein
MHLLQVVQVGGTPGGRAHKRVVESHARTELDQPGRLCRGRSTGPDPEPLDRTPQHGHVADRLDRCREEELPGLGGKRLDPSEEPLFHAAGQRHRVRESEAEGQLGRCPPAGQLQQRQRVAARLGDELVEHCRVERAVERRPQQRTGIRVVQAGDDQFRELAERLVGPDRPGREHQCDRLGQQPPGHEGERVRGGLVEPLGVIDEADQGLLLGDVGQQAQDGQTDQEAVRRVAVLQAERGAQRVPLRAGQTVEAGEER